MAVEGKGCASPARRPRGPSPVSSPGHSPAPRRGRPGWWWRGREGDGCARRRGPRRRGRSAARCTGLARGAPGRLPWPGRPQRRACPRGRWRRGRSAGGAPARGGRRRGRERGLPAQPAAAGGFSPATSRRARRCRLSRQGRQTCAASLRSGPARLAGRLHRLAAGLPQEPRRRRPSVPPKPPKWPEAVIPTELKRPPLPSRVGAGLPAPRGARPLLPPREVQKPKGRGARPLGKYPVTEVVPTKSWKGGCFAEVFQWMLGSCGSLTLAVRALSVGLLGGWRRDVTGYMGRGKSTFLLSTSKIHSIS